MISKVSFSFLVCFIFITQLTFAQKSIQLISSFAKFLETQSDKSSFPETYHFETAFEVEQQSSKDTVSKYYILTNRDQKYFGMSSNLKAREMMVFDLQMDLLIVFCKIDSTEYAISGPLSFFNSTQNETYSFHKENTSIYTSENEKEKLTITLSNDKNYNDYGLKKGFWMINQESSTVNTPLSEKGIILKIETLDKTTHEKTVSTITNKFNYSKSYSVENSTLLDFGILTDSTFHKR